MASASLPSSDPPCKYDVFLSFRGEDGFTSNLYNRLLNRGIKTFMDEDLVEAGDPISPILPTAIEESRFAIIVLSENYVSSTRCLQELTKILQCSDTNNTQVLPLFYHVDPYDVRYQRRSFEEAFAQHEKSGQRTSEEVKQWKEAVNKVAHIFGWVSQEYKSDRELVEDVVTSVCSKLQSVEIESTMTEFMDETSPSGWKYDVFFNFRSEDIHTRILSHLYGELQSKGIKIFSRDFMMLGYVFSTQLPTVIEQSRFAIVVLSENYASSIWCLEELTKIIQCWETNNTQVLPLFYHVDPSDVRYQRRSFEEAFTKYENSGRYEPEKVRKWRDALCKVASFSGWVSRDYKFERELVIAIVEYVCSKIQSIETEMFTEDFEATRQAMDEVMKALKDDEVTAVGVYGIGGVGKTTMVTRVAAQACKNEIFNQVIMAVVSQSPELRKIQGALAELLGFELKEKTEIGRAARLSMEIMKREKILIILDDVWNRIELSDIGIPSYKELQNCNSKVLLTTRRPNVCNVMNCHQEITLHVLSDEDSLTLFARNARRCFESPDFLDAGRNVARKCCGLPIALIAVARALGDKYLVEWEKAAQQIKKYIRADLEDEGDFQWIKFSYDYLPNEDCKSCFLLCCLFPYDSDIPIEDLFRYAIGTGLFRDADTIQKARGTFDSVATHLKHSSLLLDGEQKVGVRMHDIIWDAAIEIAKSEYGLEFFIKAGSGLKDWPSRLHKSQVDYSCGGGNADNQSLHLCIAEYDEGGKVSYVILGVELCNIFFTFSRSQKSQLRRLADLSRYNLPFCMGCGVWRSKILLGGGTKPRYAHQPITTQPVMGHFYHCPARQIYSFEKHSDRGDPNPNVACIPFQKMLRGNVQPLLVELDGKLYALGKSVTGASFEVFDPNNNGWSSLPYPPVNCLSYPFSIGDSRAIFDQYCATAGKNILVSDGITSYWFDTTDPKQGWRGLDRFSFMGSTVVVDDGAQFVLFSFKPSNSDAQQYISVHLISYKFDCIKRDCSRVLLPTDFSKCRPDYLGDLPLTNYTLLHIGGNTVCLVVSEQKKTFRCVAFKFLVNVWDEAAPSLKINFLHTPMLVVYKDLDMASGHMLGAFLL